MVLLRYATRSYDPRRARIALLGVGLLLVGVVATFGGIYLRERPVAAAYERAPACSAGQPPDADCRQVVPAEVARLYATGGGRSERQMIQVRLPDGSRREAQLPYEALWRKLDQGDAVTVEVWRGQVTRVQALGRDDPTSGNPAWSSRNTAGAGVAIGAILGGCLTFGAVVLAIHTHRTR